MFLLGALPQTIKLYGMTGIPITKLCASLFLGSFCVIEIIMLWLKYYRTSSSSQRPSNRSSLFDDLLRTPAFFTTLALSTHALAGAAFQPLAVPKVSYAFHLTYWTITGFYMESAFRVPVFYSTSVYFTSVAVLNYAKRRGLAASKDLDAPLTKYLKIELGNEVISQVSIQSVLSMLLLLYGGIFLDSPRAFRLGPMTRHGASIAFMLLHLLAAIVVYAVRYDPQGTYKPDWTSQLG